MSVLLYLLHLENVVVVQEKSLENIPLATSSETKICTSLSFPLSEGLSYLLINVFVQFPFVLLWSVCQLSSSSIPSFARLFLPPPTLYFEIQQIIWLQRRKILYKRHKVRYCCFISRVHFLLTDLCSVSRFCICRKILFWL